ncbi:22480_t:CDS:2, partial [Gigaspora rosea]
IHPETAFDLHGRKLHLTKGEKMEFVDMAKELGRELDLYYHFEKTIIGLCARFIMYDKSYELASLNKIMQIEDPDGKYKQIDDYAQKKAKLWLGDAMGGIYIECAKKLTKNKKFSVGSETKKKLCSDFAKHPKHVWIPEEIGPVSSMRKKETIANLPLLPHISEILELNNFRYLWYSHLKTVTKEEALK